MATIFITLAYFCEMNICKTQLKSKSAISSKMITKHVRTVSSRQGPRKFVNTLSLLATCVFMFNANLCIRHILHCLLAFSSTEFKKAHSKAVVNQGCSQCITCTVAKAEIENLL